MQFPIVKILALLEAEKFAEALGVCNLIMTNDSVDSFWKKLNLVVQSWIFFRNSKFKLANQVAKCAIDQKVDTFKKDIADVVGLEKLMNKAIATFAFMLNVESLFELSHDNTGKITDKDSLMKALTEFQVASSTPLEQYGSSNNPPSNEVYYPRLDDLVRFSGNAVLLVTQTSSKASSDSSTFPMLESFALVLTLLFKLCYPHKSVSNISAIINSSNVSELYERISVACCFLRVALIHRAVGAHVKCFMLVNEWKLSGEIANNYVFWCENGYGLLSNNPQIVSGVCANFARALHSLIFPDVSLLCVYAQVALKFNQVDVAYRSIFKCIAKKTDDLVVQIMLVSALLVEYRKEANAKGSGVKQNVSSLEYFCTSIWRNTNDILSIFQAEISVNWNSLSVYAYAAQCCKDLCFVPLAIDIYRKIIIRYCFLELNRLLDGNFSLKSVKMELIWHFILNYVHLLEITGRYGEICSEMIGVLQCLYSVAQRMVIDSDCGIVSVGGVSMSLFSDVIHVITDQWTRYSSEYVFTLNWQAGESCVVECSDMYRAKPEVYMNNGSYALGEKSDIFNLPMVLLSRQDGSVVEQRLFSESEMEFFGVVFTLIKILYLSLGSLGDSQKRNEVLYFKLPLLFLIIDPERFRSKIPLHECIIRNEHAYYQTVGSLLSLHYEHLNATAKDRKTWIWDYEFESYQIKKVYVCGDSHVMPLAWRSVQYGVDEKVILTPLLTTGLKLYHLKHLTGELVKSHYVQYWNRHGSVGLNNVQGSSALILSRNSLFYPCWNFLNCIAEIPDGADVVFIIGEIDCRDGIIGAVEKGKYCSLEEGIAASIVSYIEVIKIILQVRTFKLFLHPVLPVLDVTRPIVVRFNELLRQKVQESFAATNTADSFVKWMEFVDQLVSKNDSQELKLKTKYILDGTHIHPQYLECFGSFN